MRAAARRSDAFLDLDDLASLVHAVLHVDVVRTVVLAGILILDISRSIQGIMRPALVAAGFRNLLFRNSHSSISFR